MQELMVMECAAQAQLCSGRVSKVLFIVSFFPRFYVAIKCSSELGWTCMVGSM